MTVADPKTTTACMWLVGQTGGPDGMPLVCGRPADSPHPNPHLGYRFPLCKWHLDAELAEQPEGSQ